MSLQQINCQLALAARHWQSIYLRKMQIYVLLSERRTKTVHRHVVH